MYKRQVTNLSVNCFTYISELLCQLTVALLVLWVRAEYVRCLQSACGAGQGTPTPVVREENALERCNRPGIRDRAREDVGWHEASKNKCSEYPRSKLKRNNFQINTDHAKVCLPEVMQVHGECTCINGLPRSPHEEPLPVRVIKKPCKVRQLPHAKQTFACRFRVHVAFLCCVFYSMFHSRVLQSRRSLCTQSSLVSAERREELHLSIYCFPPCCDSEKQ